MGNNSYVFVSHASADNERLRPVIVALLDAQISLWFDKPRSLKLDRSLFAGFIDEGQKWKDLVPTAIAKAACFLVFPSSGAAMSNDVSREVGVATNEKENRARDDRDYDIIASLLEKKDDAFEYKVTGGIHSFSTAVAKSTGGAYVLTEKGLVEVEALIDRLKRAIDAQSKPVQRKPPANIDDLEMAYRVDRFVQRDSVISALRPEQSRPPAFIVHGPDSEVPRRFTSTSLALQTLRHGSVRWRYGVETARIIRVRLPTATGGGPTDFKELFLYNMVESFQGVGSPTDLSHGAAPPAERLADAFVQNAVTRIVASSLDPENSDSRSASATIRAWVEFWNEFPFARATRDGIVYVVPILEVLHPIQRRGLLGIFSGQSYDSPIARQLSSEALHQTLRERSDRIFTRILPELSSVTTSCVREWVDTDTVFALMRENEKERLIGSLLGAFRLGSRDRLTMSDWVACAGPILAEFGIRKEEALST